MLFGFAVNLLEEPLRKSSCATLHVEDYFSAPVRLPGSTDCALIISDEMPLPLPRSSLLPVLIFSLHSTGLLDYHLSIWGHQSFKVVDAVNTLSPGCMRMETIQPEPYRREGGVAARSHNGVTPKRCQNRATEALTYENHEPFQYCNV
jgi:hypothetical protein